MTPGTRLLLATLMVGCNLAGLLLTSLLNFWGMFTFHVVFLVYFFNQVLCYARELDSFYAAYKNEE